ncbi:beta-N-acetylhexosaminidase [Arthrobacter sp. zg-Y750]|uniref:beta-N-acetylhexosaminidase n=1 Tax=Arthrobacter sp. zg-Y750 TaxID=2894189 RepID=UPI001E608FB8|nr:beta-N-acetylhexosaminidase [Arthrobacter sp. zg-Y750]MCC9177113.1 beta-N-acetylhexosaminidase [Arthrobacter sp. zg-Y750]
MTAENHTLIPLPRSTEFGGGDLEVGPEATLSADPGLRSVRRWLASALGSATGWELLPAAENPTLELLLDPSLAAEEYRLDIEDRIVIRAAGAAGAFYGAQTLLQLMGPDALRQAPATAGPVTHRVPQGSVADGPRYGYRGVMLDVARHFMPKDNIFRFLDVMALHKLNVLHLHLTDDQGWRMEIRRYPELTRTGAWRRESSRGTWRAGVYDGVPHGGYYTQADLREIVAFAAERHITVIPEIDVPGHSQAAIAAYPELGSGTAVPEVWTRWGINETVLDISEASLDFYRNVLDEVLEVFPAQWISLGGDEVPVVQWERSETARAKARDLGLDGVAGLHSWFVGQLAQHLSRRGRTAAVWDEVGDGGLPDGALVSSWRGFQGGLDALAKGYDVVMCPEQHLYLDHRQADGDQEPVPVGFLTTLESVYGFEPLPASVAGASSGRLLGAQANIWTEHLDSPRRVQFAAYPRLCALAEVLWSPQDRRNYAGFLQRLEPSHLARLGAMGVEYRPLEGPHPWQQRPGVAGWIRDHADEPAEMGG